jgi:hypothetical protein
VWKGTHPNSRKSKIPWAWCSNSLKTKKSQNCTVMSKWCWFNVEYDLLVASAGTLCNDASYHEYNKDESLADQMCLLSLDCQLVGCSLRSVGTASKRHACSSAPIPLMP